MIDIALNSEKKHWDQYAAENVMAKFSHLYDWGEGLAATYSLPIFRLATINRETHRMTGSLPLILFAPPGKSKRLISLPYTDAAGILADDGESGRRLVLAALELADSLGADHVELRQGGALQSFVPQHPAIGTWCYTPNTFKTGLFRSLPTSVNDLRSSLLGKVRNQVRKARRCGCDVKVGGLDLFADFFRVFSENMRDLGSPVHAPELFRSVIGSESLQAVIIVVYLHAQPVASAVFFLHRETAFNPWASSLRSYRPSCPNMLLYWSMLEYAVQNRCRWFDFGRSSPDAATCRFKVQWGAEMDPLIWHVFSRKPHSWDPRSESLEYENWKKTELECSRRDGPAIRRWISL